MATITIDLGTAQRTQRILNAIGSQYGYSTTLPDGSPNPTTLVQFCRQHLIDHLKQIVIAAESGPARDAGAASVVTDVTNNLPITAS